MSTGRYQTRRKAPQRQNTGTVRRSGAGAGRPSSRSAVRRRNARRQAAAGRSYGKRRRRMTRRQRKVRILRRRILAGCLLILLLICGLAVWHFRRDETPGPEYAISEACEAYRPEVERLAKEYDMTDYVDLIMAVMMQESAGKGLDVMQSSEGQFNTEYPKQPGGITDPSYSIACGIQELRHALILAGAKGPRDLPAIRLALQGYNFGADSYMAYMKEQKETEWSHASASEFARMASGGVMRQEDDSFYKTAGEWQYGDQYYPEHVLRYYPYSEKGT